MVSNHFMVTLPSRLERSSTLHQVMQELAAFDQWEVLHKHNGTPAGLGIKVVRNCAGEGWEGGLPHGEATQLQQHSCTCKSVSRLEKQQGMSMMMMEVVSSVPTSPSDTALSE